MPVESIEEKPWRKAGADISDYFNYGFDEKSWKTYCRKQKSLCAANTKLRVQKGHNRRRDEELSCVYASSGRSSRLASRESRPSTDVIGGRPGSSRRVQGHQCLSDEGNNTQVRCEKTEVSSKKDGITSYHRTPPSNVGSLFAYTSLPSCLYQRGPPPIPSAATLDSGHVKGCDDVTSQYPLSSGTVTLSAGVIKTAKAWEYYILQGNCDKDRDRSREHGHDKTRKRERDREGGSSCSQNSGEERVRHRDTMERRYRHLCFERDNGEKEERHRKRRQKNERWQKAPRSSSSRSRSRRDDSEDRKDAIRKRTREMGRTGRQTRSSPLTMKKIKSD